MNIIIPLPPPENERLIFDKHHKRFILSNKYRKYKDSVWKELLAWKSQNRYTPISPTFESQLEIRIEPFMENKRRDPHGMLKPLLDCLQGFVYDNDRWVVPQFMKAQIDAKFPHVRIQW